MKSENDLFIFYVKDDGTLIAEGIEGPKTRFEGYGIASDVFDHIHSIQDIANEYRSVVDVLIELYWDWRDHEIGLLLDEVDDDDTSELVKTFDLRWDEDFLDESSHVSIWLNYLDKEQFAEVSRIMRHWASEAPDGSEDGLMGPTNGYDAAFEWFNEGMFSDEAEQIGIDIIEGDVPGSDYVAAVLPISIEEANEKCIGAGINIRFIKFGNNDDNS